MGREQTPALDPALARAEKKEAKRLHAAKVLDITNPEISARLEVAAMALGQGKNAWRALQEMDIPLPNGGTAKRLSPSQAAVYVKRAKLDLLTAMAKPRAEMLAECLGYLQEALRMAAKSGKASELVEVVDYQNLVLGLPNRSTAARTIHLPVGPPPKTNVGELSDDQLAAVILADRSTKAAAEDA
jgi:hypothetical protein